jgi:hypothetical protein
MEIAVAVAVVVVVVVAQSPGQAIRMTRTSVGTKLGVLIDHQAHHLWAEIWEVEQAAQEVGP